MRVVGYVRVSTAGQAEEGLGLEVQERAIRKWAKQNQHRLVAIERDEGISGANGIENRLGLHRALTLLEGEAEGLVVYQLDRLARNLTIQETTLAKMWDIGARVYSVDAGEVNPDDPSNPMGTALRQMVGVFAQLEKGMIAARLQAGRQLTRDKGKYAYGRPPFGWRAPATDAERKVGQLLPEPREQDVIAYMLWLRKRHKRGLREIAEILNAEGIHPKGGAGSLLARGTKKPQDGPEGPGRWHIGNVSRVLDRGFKKPKG
jgi:DNA invertase Pin-like site-specific DNA recombinase